MFSTCDVEEQELQEQQWSKARDFTDRLIMAARVFWVDLSRQSRPMAAVWYKQPNMAENVSLIEEGLWIWDVKCGSSGNTTM